MVMPSQSHPLARDELIRVLTAYKGFTTAPGAGDGSTLIDANLIGANDFVTSKTILIMFGNAIYETSRATVFNPATGAITVDPVFNAPIIAGTIFRILNIPTGGTLTALITMLEANQYYDRVFYDSVTGIAGAAWPVGTPQVPSDVIADVILMCAARNLKVIDVHGALTLGAAMAHYTFVGHRHEDVTDALDLNGQDVDSSIISKCVVTGAQGAVGLLTLEDCLVYLLTNFQGIANNCDLYGSAMSLRTASFADMQNCNSVHSDLTITVNAPTRASFKKMSGNCTFTAQTGGVLYIRGYKGTLVIDLMTGGTCDIYANGADITINANCTGGAINIYGNARVTDNSGATVVTDYTKETQLDGIEASVGRQLFTMDFWSDPQEEVQVPAAAATLVFTPTVTVADLPGTATIVRAMAMFKFRMVENTYDGVNSLDGATNPGISQVIQIKEAGGAYIDAINFVDLQFSLANLTREGGDVLIGSENVVGEVDVNGVYTFQWLMRKAVADFINFNDCAVGIRIWYSI